MSESFCKKKKIGRCNLQIAPPCLILEIAPPYLILLYVRVLVRVILQEKNLGGAIYAPPCLILEIAPPYLILLYVRVSLQEKKIWAVQFRKCTAQGGRAVHAPPFWVQFSDIRPLAGYQTVSIFNKYKNLMHLKDLNVGI